MESAVRREQKPQTEIHQAGKLPTANNPAQHHVLATYKHNWHLVTKGMHPDGESGRSGIHPIHFCRVAWQSTSTASTFVNVLWPFVPAAIVLHFARPDLHVWMLAINYIAMVPAANLLGFGEQELARKLPKVGGILFETALGSVLEIVLFLVLIEKDNGTGDVSTPGDLIPVIQAVILGCPNLGEVGRRPFSATFSQEHRYTRFVSAPGAKTTVTIRPGVPRTQMTRRALTGNTSVGLVRDSSREESQPSVKSSHDPSSLSQPQYANAGQPTEVPYKFPLTFATCKMAPTIPPKPSPAMNPAAMA